MALFQNLPKRYACLGLRLTSPIDVMPPGKYPVLSNVRSTQLGDIQPRGGNAALTGAALTNPIHSIGRINDSTAFASTPFHRVFGASTKIFTGVAGTYSQLDTGYSGNPLCFVDAQPVNSPQPWIYVGDASRQRKFNVNDAIYPIGIAAPVAAPAVTLGYLNSNVIAGFGGGVAFVAAGTQAGAVSGINRVNTTISAIYYDSGSTGNCSVVPTSLTGIDAGMLMTFKASETTPVQQMTIAVQATTIGAIIYDAGTSGLCTIQPVASLGTGQLDTPTLADYQRRSAGYGVPRGRSGGVPLPVDSTVTTPRIRQVDFPVNCLVRLNSGGGNDETVRILSVALGHDGVQSFRCSTAGTHVAAETITGVAAFRANTLATFAAADALADTADENVITPTGTPFVATAGIKSGGGWTPAGGSPALIGGSATTPDDDLHLVIRASDCTVVDTVRIYLDVDASTNDYTQNYYFFEWRASDIIAAIQASLTNPISSLQDTRLTTVTNAQLNSPLQQTAVARGGVVVPTPTTTSAAGTTASIQRGNPNDPNFNKALAIATNATSAALAIGNNQWITLRCKISQLVRVGTDPTRTLANVAALSIIFDVTSPTGAAITVDYDKVWLSGGAGTAGGPDVGDVGAPLVYYYRYRSTITGAKSNWSPASRGGVIPRRQNVVTTGIQCTDTQCDVLDWARMGGTLTTPTYCGTTPNSATPTFTDTYLDSVVSGGESIAFDAFQPWATNDLPRTGTCSIAGSAIKRTGGTDSFNTSWAPGTAIIVQGQTYTLYAQPGSSTLLQINENAGSATGVTFFVPNPTLLSQPLRSLWGNLNGILFACGDPNNPGVVYWTFPGDPDRTSDTNTLIVTSGNERLQNGFIWDGRSYVFSSDELYYLQPNDVTGFTPNIMPCGKGSWTPWSFCVAPDGIYFLGKDGIYVTQGGGVAVSITDDDLYPLFPHDQLPGVTTNTVVPPDMTQTTRLRLSYVNGWVYFDYLDTGSASRTLAYRISDKSWWYDTYHVGVASRYAEPGAAVFETLLGGTDGNAYTVGGTDDAGSAISCEVDYPADDSADSRLQKAYGDLTLDADAGNGAGFAVTAQFNNAATTVGPTTLLAATTGRQLSVPMDFSSGGGQLARNVSAKVTWTAIATSTVLYGWMPSVVPKVSTSAKRATDWNDLGTPGAKWIQGIVIRADTFNVAKAVDVQYDGGTVGVSLSIQHNGETSKAYPLVSGGAWTPFIGHLVRLIGTDTNPWNLYEDRLDWVWEPAPELATEWYPQPSNFDAPGFLNAYDIVIAHISTADLTLSINYDNGGADTYTIPNSAGVYARTRVILKAKKGKSFLPFLTTTAGARVFQKDTVMRVSDWAGNGYRPIAPFGGNSRVVGARI